ncbi:neuraminidase-like domain-containing protein [Arsenophonus apicola]|uniref:Tc toxin subunit A-related protein n=1 Tax=Arsenophonus apicola TaxID=2879119 RepID=UPI003879479F
MQAKNSTQYRQQITRQAIPKQSTHLVATQLETNFSNAKAQQLQYDETMAFSNNFIPNRDTDFVNQGNIASMFSPAAYLVRLYREAQTLHPANSPYNIDNRRPDLADLILSQENMDTPLSTLSLSNQILAAQIGKKIGDDDKQKILDALAQDTLNPDGPYYYYTDAIQQVLQNHNVTLAQLIQPENRPANTNQTFIICTDLKISPPIYTLLTTAITPDNLNAEYQKVFGAIAPQTLMTAIALAEHYYLPPEFFELLLPNKDDTEAQLKQHLLKVHKIVLLHKTTQLTPLTLSELMTEYSDNITDNTLVDILHIKQYEQFYRLQEQQARIWVGIKISQTAVNGQLSQYDQLFNNPPLYGQKFAPDDKEYDVAPNAQNVFKSNLKQAFAVNDQELYQMFLIFNDNDNISLCKNNITYTTAFYEFYLLATANQLTIAELTILYDLLDHHQIPIETFINKLHTTVEWLNNQNLNVASLVALTTNNFDTNQSPEIENLIITLNSNLHDTTLLDNPLKKALAPYFASQLALSSPDIAYQLLVWLDNIKIHPEDLDTNQFWQQVSKIDIDKPFTLSQEAIRYCHRIAQLALITNIFKLSLAEVTLIVNQPDHLKKNLTKVYPTVENLQFITQFHNWTMQLMTQAPVVITTLSKDQLTVSMLAKAINAPLDEFTAAAQQVDPLATSDTIITDVQHCLFIQQWYQAGEILAVDATVVGSLYDPSNNYPLSLSSLQLQTQLPFNQLKVGIANITKEYHKGNFYQAAVIDNDGDIELWDLVRQKIDAYYLYVEVYPFGNNQFKIIYQTEHPDSRKLGWGWLSPKGFQYLGNVKDVENEPGSHYELTTYIDWHEIEDTDMLTLVLCDHGDPITTISPVNFQRQDYPTQSFIDQLATELKIAIPTQPDLDPFLFSLATSLLNALNKTQRKTVDGLLAENLSSAQSYYYLEHVADNSLALTNRDQLYSYLLIDNQDSYQVTTSQIAAANASVQLYINRCIQQPEHEVGVNYSALQRPFFQNWEQYNRRYSSWAGIRELDYYPENYIDPTQRIGQTQMMNKLLQAINQSQLTSDIVEQAYHNYLTDFELVANLTIISGYHDELNVETGFTYLLGASQEASPTYSWRSLNHNMFINQGFPADAWSEWQAITASAKPYRNLIRPMIYKSRLYLFWLEQRQINVEKKDNAKKAKEPSIPEYTYDLKNSHLLYDGNWSTPYTYTTLNIRDGLLLLLDKDNPDIHEQVGLFVSSDLTKKDILVILYQKHEKYDQAFIPEGQAWEITQDFSLIHDNNEQTNYFLSLQVIKRELDTTRYLGVPAPFIEHNKVQVPTNIITTFYSIAPAIPNGLAPLSQGLSQLLLAKEIINNQYSLTGTIIRIEAKGQDNHYLNTGDNDLDLFMDHLQQIYQTTPYGQVLVNYYNVPNFPTKFVFLTAILKLAANKYTVVTYTNNTSFFASSIMRTFNGIVLPNKQQNFDNWQTDVIDAPDNSTLAEIYTQANGQVFTVDGNAEPSMLIQRPYKYILAPRAIVNGLVVPIQPKEIVNGDSTWNMILANQAWNFDINENITSSASNIELTITVRDRDNGNLGSVTHVIPLERKTADDTQPLLLKTASNKAQYMEGGLSYIYQSNKLEKHSGIYQVRLNTLFAKELTSRADRGLDTLLSLDTQYMPEPNLPRTGVQVTLTLKPYNEIIHGSNKIFKLRETDIWVSGDSLLIYTGELSDQPTTVTCFLNRYNDAHGNKDNLYLEAEYQSGKQPDILFHKIDGKKEWQLDKNYHGGTFPGLESIDNVESFFAKMDNTTEPMDFAGANALYFWELFYYGPMLVMKRLMQEQNFADSASWLKFIFSSAGYDRGQQNQYWNTRPLLEDTSWNEVPEDITDPDAIAQADPMHYKLSTLMNMIELLIARGDQDYRQLERDTLAEAKMWYVQALELMGEDEPSRPTSWQNPTLKNAAQLEEHAIFKPEKNTKWQELRFTLIQKLYNLRHNLTIDGKPLSLPLFATPANPADLLSAAVANAQGGIPLPTDITLGLYRFPPTLESAKGVVTQLTQYGNTLLAIIERQDAEKMAMLLQTQGLALSKQSLEMQKTAQDELNEEKKALQIAITAAKERKDHYKALYDQNMNTGEQKVIDLHIAADTLMTTTKPIYMAAALANLAPNIFGLADGGMQYGAVPTAIALGIETAASGILTSADKTTQSEIYRRRRQDWQQMYQTADYEEQQLTAQLAALEQRLTAANQQYNYLATQQTNTLEQFNLLKNKFTNEALYNWLRGRLSAIYFQFYDLVIARCLRAQSSFQWETQKSSQFIKPGAWQSTYAGLLCGEALMLNLVTMEEAYLKWEARALDVDRTVSLAEFYQDMPDGFDLRETIRKLINGESSGPVGNGDNKVSLDQNTLSAAIKIADLKIQDDYPSDLNLGNVRRIKQISVSLPALIGPYQDIQAVLEYTGAIKLSNGCKAIAISRGTNDSGQFQLDFNDSKYLPFEGIPIEDQGGLILQFPNATEKQKALLNSLTDIILHIRYTIRDNG